MKPLELKYPDSLAQLEGAVSNKVLFLSQKRDPFSNYNFPGWSDPLFFDKVRPICIEFCAGNGAWIAQKAFENQEMNWVGVERQFKRVRKIWSKKCNHVLNNLLPVCGEAFLFSTLIETNSVSEIFINFPDPWPKKRHHKHRLINPLFIEQLARILKEEGKVTAVTDDLPYRNWIIDCFKQHPSFCFRVPETFIETPLSYGTSYFDSLWREKGKQVFTVEVIKNG